MLKYFLKRIVLSLFTLWFILTLTFILMHSIPGKPFDSQNIRRTEIKEALNKKYGLDKPVHEQYIIYMKNAAHGDLGMSYKEKNRTVNDIIFSGLPYSATIGLMSAGFILVIGVTMGVVAALKKNKVTDRVLMIIATAGATIPSFVIATGFLYIFSKQLNWVPSFGVGSFKHYIGPIVAVSVFSISFVSRLSRTSVIEEMNKDYIRTARSKGTPESKVIVKHALRNALIPVVTYAGPMIAGIVTGSFVVEKVFGIPGIGKLFTQSILDRDYTVIMGITIFFSIILIAANLIVDLLYLIVDPRIKLE